MTALANENLLQAINDAISASPERKFQQSIDLAFNLRDVDLSVPKNRIDEDILLPHGRGAGVKVALIGAAELVEKARGVADTVITPEELDELAKDRKAAKRLANKHSFFVAEAPMMPTVGKTLGIVLGPRGKMPRPVPPGGDPSGVIDNLRRTVKVRSKDRRTFHSPLGNVDMAPEQLAENAEAIIKRVQSRLERGHHNIQSIYVKTTMGPSVRIPWSG